MNTKQTTSESASKEHVWLASLVRELFQTEQSARSHPRVEIERLGDAPPAAALRAVAAHADASLNELTGLVQQQNLPVSLGGRAIGEVFSALRDRYLDMFLSAEKSYRGTLIGMHHGVDLVTILQEVARREGATALADWCAVWLERRRGLVDDAQRALSWFAENPERAQEAATHRPLARGLQSLLAGFEHLADRLRRPPAPAGSSPASSS